MAEWSVVDVPTGLPSIHTHQQDPQHGDGNNGGDGDGGSNWHAHARQRRQQHQQHSTSRPNDTSPRRRNLRLTTSPAVHGGDGGVERQLSPRVRQAIRSAQRRSPQRRADRVGGSSSSTTATNTSAGGGGGGVARGLSLGAVAQARKHAAPRNLAISRYVDEASPVPGSERGPGWSTPLGAMTKLQSKKRRGGRDGGGGGHGGGGRSSRPAPGAAQQQRRQQQQQQRQGAALVGVTKKDYWKVWNNFLQDKTDPRVMLPAGVRQADVERVFAGLAAVADGRGGGHGGGVSIPRRQLRSVLDGIGVSTLDPDREQQLFLRTRTTSGGGGGGSGDGVDAGSNSGSDGDGGCRRASPMRGRMRPGRSGGGGDGYTLAQVLACFVQIRQAEPGAPFAVCPLGEGDGDRANGCGSGGSVDGDGGGGGGGSGEMGSDTLPPIREGLVRSPSAPANMRRAMSGPRSGSGGGGVLLSTARSIAGRSVAGSVVTMRNGKPVVYTSSATAKNRAYSSYDKFKLLEAEDRRAGRLERDTRGVKGWSAPKSGFVRTGDKYMTEYERQVMDDKKRKEKFIAGPFVVTDHRAAVAEKEWKLMTDNVHKARRYDPKHGNDHANLRRFNKMFGD